MSHYTDLAAQYPFPYERGYEHIVRCIVDLLSILTNTRCHQTPRVERGGLSLTLSTQDTGVETLGERRVRFQLGRVTPANQQVERRISPPHIARSTQVELAYKALAFVAERCMSDSLSGRECSRTRNSFFPHGKVP